MLAMAHSMGAIMAESKSTQRHAERYSSTKPNSKSAFLRRFYDPDFEPLQGEIDKIAEIAWDTYDEYHKARVLRKPEPALPIRTTTLGRMARRQQANIQAAERRQKDRKSPSRVS